MPAPDPILHLVCGKIAAGKSTLTARLAAAPMTILLSEDDWLPRLYPENETVEDYVRTAARLRAAIGPHVVALLKTGLSVALDFPANTPANRAWMRSLFEEAGAAHRLHFLDVPEEVCKARLRARNESGDHNYAVSETQFDQITAYFVAPRPDEGFEILVHRP